MHIHLSFQRKQLLAPSAFRPLFPIIHTNSPFPKPDDILQKNRECYSICLHGWIFYCFVLVSVRKNPPLSYRDGFNNYQRVLITAFSRASVIKFRVECIEILAVQTILYDSETFAESLVMHDFTCPKETNRISNFRIFYQT